MKATDRVIRIPEDATSSGITIRYYKAKKQLWIAGWYDSCVGLEGRMIPLGEFLRLLGITSGDVVKCFSGKEEA